MRESVKRWVVGRGGGEVERLLLLFRLPRVDGWGDVGGARRSVIVPVRRRARVDMMATIETCVAAVVRFAVSPSSVAVAAGYSVPMIVPRLLIKASPGPVTRKKPAASHHIV